MRIRSTLLALCVLHSHVWGTTAFAPVAPTFQSKGHSFLKATKADAQFVKNLATADQVKVQGGALRTWPFGNVERLLVNIVSDVPPSHYEGRLVKCNIDVCTGPDRTPMKMKIYSGKGKYRPFKAVVEVPGGYSSLFIRNTGELEFPVIATVNAATSAGSNDAVALDKDIYEMSKPQILQGGSVTTFPLDGSVNSAKVQLMTEGRPLNVLIEVSGIALISLFALFSQSHFLAYIFKLVQGPDSVKSTIDLYAEDGMERPFFCVLATPGAGNTVRLINQSTIEFPVTICVEPFDAKAD